MSEIPVKFAKKCIADYAAYMRKLGVNVEKDQTNMVSFHTKDLKSYFDKHHIFEESDEVRVYFGVYPKGVEKLYASAKAGRISVILWPHKNGKPLQKPYKGDKGDRDEVEPYNMGHLNP